MLGTRKSYATNYKTLQTYILRFKVCLGTKIRDTVQNHA